MKQSIKGFMSDVCEPDNGFEIEILNCTDYEQFCGRDLRDYAPRFVKANEDITVRLSNINIFRREDYESI